MRFPPTDQTNEHEQRRAKFLGVILLLYVKVGAIFSPKVPISIFGIHELAIQIRSRQFSFEDDLGGKSFQYFDWDQEQSAKHDQPEQ